MTVTGEPKFRKSSFSPTDNCVEIARSGDRMLVRDSKNPDGPVLAYNRGEWDAFTAGVQAGELGWESEA